MNKVLSIIFALFSALSLFAQELETPEVIKVSYNISNNHIQIYWEASLSPETTYYEVWYADNDATEGKVSYLPVPYAEKVYASAPLFLEFQHDRTLQSSQGYFITAFNDIGGESKKMLCDSTVFLKVTFDSCLASATLQWNDYNSWRGKITGYKIYSSTDGINYNLVQALSNTTNEYVVNNLNAYQLYRFYVLVTRNSPSDSSYSNRVDVNTKMAAIPSYIHADYGTAGSGHPVVTFSVDPSSELSNYIVLRSESPSSGFDSIATINSKSKSIVFTDISASSSQRAYYYKLNTLNYCNQVVRSSDNIAGTIYLETSFNERIINLNWNSYQNWIEGVESYTIDRRIGGQDYEVISTTSDLTYTDRTFESAVGEPIESEVCYRVTAKKAASTADQFHSISNESCITLNSNIRFDFNAFMPEGTVNNTFGPVMDFIPKSIKFRIFNRWGNMLFESNDPYNLRWNGTNNSKKVGQGVYRYELVYVNENGKENVIHGNVTVIYP